MRGEVSDETLAQVKDNIDGIQELFPELHPYAGPSANEKHRHRHDEGGLSTTQPSHTSRIMDIRPVFVSVIEPAKNRYDDQWKLQSGLWEVDYRPDISSEGLSTQWKVFEGFGPATHRSGVPSNQTTAQMLRPPVTWTDEEDQLLQRLAKTYPYNWSLIADSFNTEIVRAPTERRTAHDCADRWYWTFGPGKGKPRPGSATQATVPPSASQPGTAVLPPGSAVPGSARPDLPATASSITVPTLPGSQSATEGVEGPPPPFTSKRDQRAAAKNKYEGSRRSIRHQVIADVVRRQSRRREAQKAKAGSGWLNLCPHDEDLTCR